MSWKVVAYVGGGKDDAIIRWCVPSLLALSIWGIS